MPLLKHAYVLLLVKPVMVNYIGCSVSEDVAFLSAADQISLDTQDRSV